MDDGVGMEHQLQSVVPSDLLNPELRRAVAEEFGPDGAWLLLSILRYSWRAHWDLAVSVLGGAEPRTAPDLEPRPPVEEFRAARHLHILGLTYAAAEMLATLLIAARAHSSRTTAFIDTYASVPYLPNLVPDLLAIEEAELRDLLGEADDIDLAIGALRSDRQRRYNPGPFTFTPDSIPVAESIGGLLIPQSVIGDVALEAMRERALGLVPQVLVNIRELQQLVEVPEQPDAMPMKPQSMRSIDNSFRHGMRVLYHSTVPDARNFRYVGDPQVPDSSEQVTVYTPSRKGDQIEFGGVSCGHHDTQSLMEALEQLCLRIGQVSRAFVGKQCKGFEGLILATEGLRLGVEPSEAAL